MNVIKTAFWAIVIASPVFAEPKITEITKYYDVSGRTATQLRADMRKNGPKGFWAYTTWWVRWDGRCNTDVKLEFIYPKIVDRAKTPLITLKKWDRMLAKLEKHERQHAQHGINAAFELEKTKCKRGNTTVRKWSNQDKIYDKRTNHGANEGVGVEFVD